MQAVEELRVHLLAPEIIPHWREVLEASWRDFDAAPGGGDPLALTRRRGLAALEELPTPTLYELVAGRGRLPDHRRAWHLRAR